MNGIGVDTVVADPLLAVHVLAGVVALGAGLAAMATAKGRPRHNAAGRAYVASMAVVVVTALPLAIRIDSAFLLAVAVFSGYLVFAGYREVRRRRARLTDPTPADWAGHGTMVAVGAAMVVLGVHGTVTGTVELAPVLAVFGAIGGGAAGFTLRRFRTPLADRTPWIERHIGFMGGAYIATVTAAVTVNLTAVPPLARWLGPTLVGVPLIVYATRRYRPRFAPAA
ncbi:hypothetical protein GRS48_05590 [Halorubrum sp. JWXQ-INN 858]|uniref:hypothetical protein n=1 Tax=Halorubrum sp. JWXQ-INN 858 TaxID=2690782 RepID=UPI00135AFE1F|nr:hypothetical protein [Halorubrum sp. JWXQ-INN 858]MWV64298.1 hypothetical protein [Halorubrum sp. JWXQ-INN 858]